jgi:GNAT superfamily N-acetyltransferase
MTVEIQTAGAQDAPLIAALVLELTAEITAACDGVQFHDDQELTAGLCAEWIAAQRYLVQLAYIAGLPAGVITAAESFALYAGGKIGIVQECYVRPACRAQGVGQALMDAMLALASQRGWAAVELCTPPLPQFARAIDFYQRHGYAPVGGRKMRRPLR